LAEPSPPPASAAEARRLLDDRLLGEEPVLTVAEVAEQLRVTPSDIRRMWRALGFPTPEGEAFRSGDLDALRLAFAGVHGGVSDIDTNVRLARAVGQTVSRLADWQVGNLVTLVEELEDSHHATGSRSATGLRVYDELAEPFENLLLFAWRRHLALAVTRFAALGDMGEDLHTVTVTVGFADLVRFSALSNELDQDRIGDLVEIFETRCGDVVNGHGGRVVKTLGDSVLFVNDDPVRAMETALGITDVIGPDSRLPDVRLGLATGSVVTRLGDVFGPPVNLAARLTAIARRNRVITDDATAAALPEDRFEPRLLSARPVRGFGVLEPVAVRRH
jgi:adenylate cyclase